VTGSFRRPNSGDRAPEVVVILGFPGPDVAIGQCHVEQTEQPGILPCVEALSCGDGARDAIPCQRRALDPEKTDFSLLLRARALCRHAVAPERLDLIEVCSVLLAGEGIGRIRTELGAVAEDK